MNGSLKKSARTLYGVCACIIVLMIICYFGVSNSKGTYSANTSLSCGSSGVLVDADKGKCCPNTSPRYDSGYDMCCPSAYPKVTTWIVGSTAKCVNGNWNITVTLVGNSCRKELTATDCKAAGGTVEESKDNSCLIPCVASTTPVKAYGATEVTCDYEGKEECKENNPDKICIQKEGCWIASCAYTGKNDCEESNPDKRCIEKNGCYVVNPDSGSTANVYKIYFDNAEGNKILSTCTTGSNGIISSCTASYSSICGQWSYQKYDGTNNQTVAMSSSQISSHKFTNHTVFYCKAGSSIHPNPTPSDDSSSSSSSSKPSSSSSLTGPGSPTPSSNVDDNPKTGSVAIFMVWVIALGTLIYSFVYFKQSKFE